MLKNIPELIAVKSWLWLQKNVLHLRWRPSLEWWGLWALRTSTCPNQVWSSSSTGVQSPPSVLPASKADQSALTSTKFASKRKRSKVEVELNGKKIFSPAKKQRRICEERALLKRRYSHTAISSKCVSEICRPEHRGKTNRDDRELAVTASTSRDASSTVKLRPHNRGRTSKTTRRKKRKSRG